MSKKVKKKGQDGPTEEQTKEDQTTKLDQKIATYMKKNTPTKQTKFLHHQVKYFYASKAVDALLDSEWATGKEPLFTDRQSVEAYCNRLLNLKFFHRAKKIAITDKDLKPKELKKKREREEKERVKNEGSGTKRKREVKATDSKNEKDDGESEREETKKKKKKKIKLDMHLDQVFVDGSDAYVWMFDPVPFWYYIAGALCLVGAVAVCLFPLWPPSVRKGVYYLSVSAAGFLGFILGLAVLRFIAFMIIWLLSMGRHHLWLLPNLTEDVGFFASFWPLYHYEYRGVDYECKKSKRKRQRKLQQSEEGQQQQQEEEEAEDSALPDDVQDIGSGCDSDRQTDDRDRPDESSNHPGTTDSDNSQHSQPFEMVDREDLHDDTDDEDLRDEEYEDRKDSEDEHYQDRDEYEDDDEEDDDYEDRKDEDEEYEDRGGDDDDQHTNLKDREDSVDFKDREDRVDFKEEKGLQNRDAVQTRQDKDCEVKEVKEKNTDQESKE